MAVEYRYITTAQELADAAQSMSRASTVTVDTEFARSTTYYPGVGLIQIYDGTDCLLIDPLAIDDLSPLVEILTAPHILKVFHACSEDLEVFQYAVGAVPVPIFDTQIAAAALGIGFSMSYANLVEHHLGVALPKEETRSDWLARPLTAAQLEYAALDVVYLLEVFKQQQELLQGAGKSHWVEEECADLSRDIAILVDPMDVYFRVKSAGRMTPSQLNRLQRLCAWREQIARQRNVPRNRVIDEKSLVQVARTDIRSTEDLRHRAGLTARQVGKHGDAMMDVLEQAATVPESEWPSTIEDKQSVRNDHVKLLRKVVEDRAEALKIAPELLAKRRQLEQLLRGGGDELPESLGGWRRQAIGEHLLAALGDLK
jgi:ribonuclease D